MSRTKKKRKPQRESAVMYVLLTVGVVVGVSLAGGLAWFLISKMGTQWETVELPGGGGVVELPATITEQETRDFHGPFGAAKATFCSCKIDSPEEVYTIVTVEAPLERLRSADAKTILQDTCNGMLGGMMRYAQDAQLKSSMDKEVEGFPAKDVVIEVPNHGMGVTRWVLVGRRMIGLLVGGPKVKPGNARVERFINSLRITDSKLVEQGRLDLALMPRVAANSAGQRVNDYNGGPVPAATDMPGLVLYLSFDQPGPDGQVIDVVTGRPAARLMGGATYGAGVRGKGLDLNGKGRYLDYSLAAERVQFKANAAFTFSLWVRTAAHSSDGMIFSERGDKPGGGILQIGWKGTGYLNPVLIRAGSNGVEQANITGPQLKVPFWNHLALTRQADGEMMLYLNGKPVVAGPGPKESGAFTAGLCVIGANAQEIAQNFKERTFAGEVDEFCVFNRALKVEEINRLAGVK
jgi:hypothetical protein